MKRFKFTLEAVQTVRARAAREALEQYARGLRALSDAERALASANEAKTAHLAEWRGAMGKGFSPGEMLAHGHARTMLEARCHERLEEVRQAADATAKAQAAFQLARQKSEVVEKFHARQRNEFNLNALKEEQHFLDEIAASRRDAGLLEKGVAHA